MNKRPKRPDTKAPGHYGNKGPGEQGSRASQPDREERHQLKRELAPTDQKRQSKNVPPGGSATAAGPAEGNRADADRAKRKESEGPDGS
jgi:hypothetical protein